MYAQNRETVEKFIKQKRKTNKIFRVMSDINQIKPVME